jgi:hypothetical protein
MSVRLALVLLASLCLLVAASPALAEWGECERCHLINFSPRHDPEELAASCEVCHPPEALHFIHPWEEACQGCHADDGRGPVPERGPRIFELDHSCAQTRQMLVIRGTGFGHAQGTGAVRIGRIHYGAGSPKVLSWSNTEIRVRLPAYRRWESGRRRTRNVKVIVEGVRSNRVALEIVHP